MAVSAAVLTSQLSFRQEYRVSRLVNPSAHAISKEVLCSAHNEVNEIGYYRGEYSVKFHQRKEGAMKVLMTFTSMAGTNAGE